MARIVDAFRDKGITRGKTTRFLADDALAVVRECRKRRVLISGVDGFFLTEHTTQPSMENSVDLSDIESFHNPVDCWTRAERFIQINADKGLYFEIVMDDHE